MLLLEFTNKHFADLANSIPCACYVRVSIQINKELTHVRGHVSRKG